MEDYVVQYMQLTAAVTQTAQAVKEAMEALNGAMTNLHMLIHHLDPEMFFDGEDPDDFIMKDPEFD
jgi:signal transduction histidine kinase